MYSANATMRDMMQSEYRRYCKHRAQRLTLIVASLLLTPALTLAQDLETLPGSAPPDVEIKLWEQHWTQQADGTIVYHEKKHTRFNNDRAYRELADPRITYNVANDQLEIIVARTRLPDGSYRELPDYGHVKVSPNASEGWPAFAHIRQHLLVMSGLEPGCVTELEYRITTRPGVHDHVAADLALVADYPIRERRISITVPDANTAVHAFVNNPSIATDSVTTTDAGQRYQWICSNVSRQPPEPYGPTNRELARLAFTTAGDAQQWTAWRLDQLEQAINTGDAITKLVNDCTANLTQPAAKLAALQEMLAKTFNVVQFPANWRSASAIRPASDVFEHSYGTPDEAAVVLAALARAAGLTARPALVIADELWSEQAAQESMIATFAVVLEDGEARSIWHPQHGRIVRDGQWAEHTIVWTTPKGIQRHALPAWQNTDDSKCNIHGTLTIADDAQVTGELTVHTSGLFVVHEDLRDSGGQKRRLQQLVTKILPGAKINKHSVTELADATFTATVDVALPDALEQVHGAYMFQLAAESPFQTSVPIPLNHATRMWGVRLPGPFVADLTLRIEWPEDWTVDARPLPLTQVDSPAGGIVQTVAHDAAGLRLHRRVDIRQRNLPFASTSGPNNLQRALNTLASEAYRTLILRK